ncbi:MAG: hypothetical protein AAFQ17_05645 [Pseudomonadota bacterium]
MTAPREEFDHQLVRLLDELVDAAERFKQEHEDEWRLYRTTPRQIAGGEGYEQCRDNLLTNRLLDAAHEAKQYLGEGNLDAALGHAVAVGMHAAELQLRPALEIVEKINAGRGKGGAKTKAEARGAEVMRVADRLMREHLEWSVAAVNEAVAHELSINPRTVQRHRAKSR